MRYWLIIAWLANGLAGCVDSGKQPAGTGGASADRSAAMTKGQCLASYPERPGSLYQRQKCLADVALAEESTLNAAQQTIANDCARDLLALANSADKAVITLEAFQARKHQLMLQCATAMAKVTPR